MRTRTSALVAALALLLCGGTLARADAPITTVTAPLPTVRSHWSVLAYPVGSPSLDGPRGLTIDRFGKIYVADSWVHQIQELSPTGTRLGVIGHYGRRGAGQFFGPSDISFDAAGNIY